MSLSSDVVKAIILRPAKVIDPYAEAEAKAFE